MLFSWVSQTELYKKNPAQECHMFTSVAQRLFPVCAEHGWSSLCKSVPQLLRKVTDRTELAFYLSKINLNYSNSFTALM